MFFLFLSLVKLELAIKSQFSADPNFKHDSRVSQRKATRYFACEIDPYQHSCTAPVNLGHLSNIQKLLLIKTSSVDAIAISEI